MESLFFIDTGGDDQVENDSSDDNEVVEDKVLGAKDAAIEEKLRKRAIKERSLASFLFGKPKETSDAESDKSEEESDSEEIKEDDEEDSDTEKEDSEDGNEEKNEDGSGVESDENNDEDDEKEVTISSFQPTFGGELFGNKRKRKAAWEDEEDSKVLVKDVTATYKKAIGKHGQQETSTEQYKKAVSRKFKSVVGDPAWASLDKGEDEDSDDEFFRETTDVVERGKGSEHLAQEYLQFRKLKDMNYSSHKEGAVITSTEFHPLSTVGLTAGNNGNVTLSQLDGKENPKIQTINFKDFPIKTAKFSACGNQFLVGSKFHPHFYVYDMIAGQSIKVPWKSKTAEHNTAKFDVSPDGKLISFIGRFGYIHLISAKSKEIVKTMKMNDWCSSIRFSKDGGTLYSSGEGGEVYIWDIRSHDCLHKFQDEGCVVGTSLDVSSHHLATGSSAGVVNIYSLPSLTQSTSPQPDKAIMNLTTQIDHLRFNQNGEMLAMSSINKDGAIKLLHMQSLTVYKNFPGQFKHLNKVNSLGWSPGGGYFAVGNNKGAANLYRIHHYKDY